MKKLLTLLAFLSLAFAIQASHYPDSVQQASRQQERIRQGWNFEFAGGIGISQLAYQHWGQVAQEPHISNQFGFPAWNANIGISYYFLPWFGFGTGAHFSTYSSTIRFNQPWTFELNDRYGDHYIQTLTPIDLNEHETFYMVEIPFSLNFRAMPQGKKVGFTGIFGAKLGLPVYNNYALLNTATLSNQVYYPTYDLTLNGDIPSVLQDGVIEPYSASLSNDRLARLNMAGFAEIGVLFQVHQRIDLALKAYANYYITDLLPNKNRTPIGFQDILPAGEFDHTTLHDNSYSTPLNTTAVTSVHPWSVGLKLSLQINASRTDAQLAYDQERRNRKRKRPGPETPLEERPATVTVQQEQIVEDTIDAWAKHCEENKQLILYLSSECNIDLIELGGGNATSITDNREPRTDTIYIHDTVYIERLHEAGQPFETYPTRDAADILDDELKEAVIFFDFDKTTPQLEPADILIRIATILRKHPDQQIYINGHACKVGTDSYNTKLAMRRAQAVAAELQALGVSEKQMIVQSKGSREAFRYNGKQHQLSKDRRVEIIPVGIGTTEVVRPGSRLSQIARRHYGDPMLWVYIYEANRDKIQNPQDIQPGTLLRIPDLNIIMRGRTREEVTLEAKNKAEQYKNPGL